MATQREARGQRGLVAVHANEGCSAGRGSLMKHIRTASALRPAVGRLRLMMYEGWAAALIRPC